MKIFWIIVLSSFTSTIISLVGGRNNKDRSNSLYCSRGVLVVAILGLGFTLGMGALTIYLNQFTPIVLIGCSVFLGLSLGPLVLYFRLRISFYDEYFLIGKKKHSYEEITKVVIYDKYRYNIYLSHKKIAIDRLVVNSELFLKMLKKKKVLKNAEVIRKK